MSYGRVRRKHRAQYEGYEVQDDGSGQSSDDTTIGEFSEALIKLIPGEAMAAYIVLAGLIGEVSPTPVEDWGENEFGLVLTAVLSLILVIVGASHKTAYDQYRKRIAWNHVDWLHVGVAVVSFILFVYAQGSSLFNLLGVYSPLIGSILLVFWVVLSSWLFPSLPENAK